MALQTEINRVKALIVLENAKANKNNILIANMRGAVDFAEFNLAENIDPNALIISQTTLKLY